MTPDEVHQDVMSSGYWVNFCYELHLSWTSCHPGSDLNNELAENSAIENFEEVSEVDDCKDHGNECINRCRNELMEYFGWFHDSVVIFEALVSEKEFRKEIYIDCKLTFKLLGNGSFMPRHHVDDEGGDEEIDEI